MADSRWTRLVALVLGSTALLALSGCDPAPGRLSAGPVRWVSADRDGQQLPLGKNGDDISRDGRWVTLQYVADVGGDDDNGTPDSSIRDTFVRDRRSGALELVSVALSGRAGNADSDAGSISGTGRYVAFASYASDLVAGDTNGTSDVFVRDRTTRTTTRLTLAPDGTQTDSVLDSVKDISADGRWVLFTSTSDSLVPEAPVLLDGVGLFLADRTTGQISRVDRGSKGFPGNNQVNRARVSDSGRFVAFETTATNLVWPADRNDEQDVYWRDRQTGRVELVSVDRNGAAAGGSDLDMSASGGFVSFISDSSSVVAGDTNGQTDVFVRNVAIAKTQRVNLAPDGRQANGISFDSDLSDDGRRVAYSSMATNLVSGATAGHVNVFVRQLSTGDTIAVTRARDGGAPDEATYHARLSGNGSVVLLESWATNLVAGASSGMPEAYAVELSGP